MINLLKRPFPIGLTTREYQCLALLAKGYTMKMIALEYSISPRTVEQHIRNIKEKTDLRTKQELLRAWHHYHQNSTEI